MLAGHKAAVQMAALRLSGRSRFHDEDPHSKTEQAMTEEKPRIAYADLKWLAAFDAIEKGQKLTAKGVEYTVEWKHDDPDWLRLAYRADGKLQHVMVRKGDPFLLELQSVS